MMRNRRRPEGIYASHGQGRAAGDLLFVKARVNGVLSAAYVKNGELQSYLSWEEVNREMYNGPYMEFNTEEAFSQSQEDRLINAG